MQVKPSAQLTIGHCRGTADHWSLQSYRHLLMLCTLPSDRLDKPTCETSIKIHCVYCSAKLYDDTLRSPDQVGTKDAPVLDCPAPLRRLHDSGAIQTYLLIYITYRLHHIYTVAQKSTATCLTADRKSVV